MKKSCLNKKIQISVAAFCMAFLLPILANAAVKGICSKCHTMHNSQNATTMGDGPNKNLLRKTCFSCHADGSTNQPSSWNDINNPTAPQVAASGGGVPAGGMLAGGFFSAPGASTYTQMHNVYDQDSTNDDPSAFDSNEPPGWPSGTWNGTAGSFMVGCSGDDFTYGCHREGGHHTNNARTVAAADVNGTTIGRSYRFLSGVKGWEDTDWEDTRSKTDHNRYVAKDDGTVVGTGTAASPMGINDLCAKCHGDFHTWTANYQKNSDGDWIRHPTDRNIVTAAALPGAVDYDNYADYSTTVPVGWTDTTLIDEPNNDGGLVLCISCHRPHGSEYADLLRWNYNEMIAGTGDGTPGIGDSGCFKCHDQKDGVDD